MDLFLDDPNIDISTQERSQAKSLYLLSFLASIIPIFNFIVPYIYSKLTKSDSLFVAKHFSNILNTQFLILIFMLICLGLYFTVDLFYVMMFALFIFIFQSINTYTGFVAAKNGTINHLSFKLNLF